MRAPTIPLADASALRRPARRARVARLALAGALLACSIVAFLFARASSVPATPLLPPGSSGIVVLDLSASVESGTLDRMYAALTQLANSRGRFGLVICSSRAYEALPPNTPARELASVGRFFRAQPAAPGTPAAGGRPYFYPPNPWAAAFSFGTSISTGLNLPRSIIVAEHLTRSSVWLMSDLADEPNDRPLAAATARSYIPLGIRLHVIGLNPLPADAQFFERLLGPRGSLIEAQLPTGVRLGASSRFPTGLVVVAALLAVLLAVNELISTPLRWAGPAPAEAETA